jgi:hypothetical protein
MFQQKRYISVCFVAVMSKMLLLNSATNIKNVNIKIKIQSNCNHINNLVLFQQGTC